MDLSTSYLDFDLAHPLVPGSSPLADEVDGDRRLRDAGAPMITLPSPIAAPLNITDEGRPIDGGEEIEVPRSVFAGLQDAPDHASQPDRYCEHVQRVRRVLGRGLPIVASRYARHLEQWVSNAKLIEKAGADALELNTYGMAIAAGDSGQSLGEQIINVVEAVKRCSNCAEN